jgi:hypothetical protein
VCTLYSWHTLYTLYGWHTLYTLYRWHTLYTRYSCTDGTRSTRFTDGTRSTRFTAVQMAHALHALQMAHACSESTSLTNRCQPRARAARDPAGPSVKVTGLAKKLGQLEAVHRDLQSKYFANLKLLGPPCNFYVPASGQREGGPGQGGGASAPPRRLIAAHAVVAHTYLAESARPFNLSLPDARRDSAPRVL